MIFIEHLGRKAQQAYTPVEKTERVVEHGVAIKEAHWQDGYLRPSDETNYSGLPHAVAYATLAQAEVADSSRGE